MSTADFGKVMKQVYPQVRPRRLGTRGNSRYCYAGLKKRLKLEEPLTPEVCGEKQIHVIIKQELLQNTGFFIVATYKHTQSPLRRSFRLDAKDWINTEIEKFLFFHASNADRCV